VAEMALTFSLAKYRQKDWCTWVARVLYWTFQFRHPLSHRHCHQSRRHSSLPRGPPKSPWEAPGPAQSTSAGGACGADGEGSTLCSGCGNTARMGRRQLLVKHLATARTLAAGQHRRGEHTGGGFCKRASMSEAGALLLLQALFRAPAQPCLVTVHNT
jgi:hypothetical protein